MDWKQELEVAEESKAWPDAITIVRDAIAHNPEDAEVYVRAIYLLLNLLLEEDYTECGLEHDDLARMVKEYFDSSFDKFSHHADYLFFIGYFMRLAEWYFGQDTLDLSTEMLERAVQIDSHNRVYLWALRFVKADEAANDLCREILSDEKTMAWLRSKGSPGLYIAWAVKTNCEKYPIHEGRVTRIETIG
jgi:hypothetical protein